MSTHLSNSTKRRPRGRGSRFQGEPMIQIAGLTFDGWMSRRLRAAADAPKICSRRFRPLLGPRCNKRPVLSLMSTARDWSRQPTPFMDNSLLGNGGPVRGCSLKATAGRLVGFTSGRERLEQENGKGTQWKGGLTAASNLGQSGPARINIRAP